MYIDIIRVWKDELYRRSISREERDMLPEHPVGSIEMSDEELQRIYGGRSASFFVEEQIETEACSVVVCSLINAPGVGCFG